MPSPGLGRPGSAMTDSEIANWLVWRDQADMRTSEVTTVDELFLEAKTGWTSMT